MGRIELTTSRQLKELKDKSHSCSQIVFKHSTQCSLSAGAYKKLHKSNISPIWYLDLLSYRDISDQIAKDYMITHHSPQILIINKGQVIYDESHQAIEIDTIKRVLS